LATTDYSSVERGLTLNPRETLRTSALANEETLKHRRASNK
jgi:hypothetical protein